MILPSREVLRARSSLIYEYGKEDVGLEFGLELVRSASQAFGKEDQDTLGFMVLLAWTLVQRKELRTAQEILERVIDIGNRSGRGEDVFTVDARNELGWAYNHSNEPHKAIPQFRSALRVRARVYGSKDTDTLWTMHGLAFAYKLLGRFGDALPLYETVYETRIEVLGAEDIDTLETKRELDIVRKKLIR